MKKTGSIGEIEPNTECFACFGGACQGHCTYGNGRAKGSYPFYGQIRAVNGSIRVFESRSEADRDLFRQFTRIQQFEER